MRLWTLVTLLFAVTAIGGDLGTEPPAQFFERVIATSPRSNLLREFQQSERATADKCCRLCTKGKPRGDTCIAKVRHVPPRCAC